MHAAVGTLRGTLGVGVSGGWHRRLPWHCPPTHFFTHLSSHLPGYFPSLCPTYQSAYLHSVLICRSTNFPSGLPGYRSTYLLSGLPTYLPSTFVCLPLCMVQLVSLCLFPRDLSVFLFGYLPLYNLPTSYYFPYLHFYLFSYTPVCLPVLLSSTATTSLPTYLTLIYL